MGDARSGHPYFELPVVTGLFPSIPYPRFLPSIFNEGWVQYTLSNAAGGSFFPVADNSTMQSICRQPTRIRTLDIESPNRPSGRGDDVKRLVGWLVG